MCRKKALVVERNESRVFVWKEEWWKVVVVGGSLRMRGEETGLESGKGMEGWDVT